MTDTTQAAKSVIFKISSIEKTPSDENNDDQAWYRYVLENGRSTIVGQRRGTLKDVTDYATEYTEQLNERSTMARSTWSPRGRKPAPAAAPAEVSDKKNTAK